MTRAPKDMPEAAIDEVGRLHLAVDRMTAPLIARHQERLQCRVGCTGCCVDELSVFAIEAATITRYHGELLDHGEPHPVGQCAMLDADGRCRIYEHRPYVCRTQGLPLRWLEPREGDEGVEELRDICALNENVEPIEALRDDECWTLGPVENRLRAMQHTLDPDKRIPLRSLFRRQRAG